MVSRVANSWRLVVEMVVEELGAEIVALVVAAAAAIAVVALAISAVARSRSHSVSKIFVLNM